MAHDRDFLDAMEQLGVRPIDGPPPAEEAAKKPLERRARRPLTDADVDASVAADERALFLAAMDSLGVGDGSAAPAPERGASDEPSAGDEPTADAAVPADDAVTAASAPRRRRLEDPVRPEDRALFLASVERVGTADDKDAPLAEPGPRPRRAQGGGTPRKVSSSRRATIRRVEPDAVDAQLDLHRERIDPALARLRAFLVDAAVAGHGRVLVITGKGHHSESRRSVLRQAVETWLIREGGPWVARYAVAPRSLGGRGAWVVDLHRSEPR